MKNTFYIYSLIVLIFFSCKNQNEKKPVHQNTLSSLNLAKYPKYELAEDFDLMVNSLKEAHTGLYWYNSEQQFDSVVAVQRKKLRDSLNAIEFYNIAAPIVAYTKEDHCDINLSDEILNFLKKSGKFIPLSVLSVNKNIYILNNPDELTNIKGLQIKKINGIPIEHVYDSLFNTFASDGYIKQSKYRWLDNVTLSKLYAVSIGQPDDFEIEVLNPKTKKLTTHTIKAVDSKNLSQISKNVSLYPDLPPAYFEVSPGNTVVLTFTTFSNTSYEESEMNFKNFVDEAFKKIDSLKTKKLIIDIRANGGGTEGNEDYLFSYLTDKPYNKYKSVEISAFTYSFYKHTDYNKEEDIIEFETDIKEEHYLASDGRILRKKGIEEPEPIKPNPYKGKIYILTSGWTYSGGAEFSSLMKEHTNAVFIGEEVGGAFQGNTSGYSFELILPNTKISVDVPLLKFSLNVSRGKFGRGVIPDYEIQPTYKNYENKSDTVMKFARAL